MPISQRILCGILCAACVPFIASAEALVKPLPNPDVSRLPPEQAKELSANRAAFDKAAPTVVGPPLAQAYADIGVVYARAGFKDVAAVAFYDAAQVSPQDARWLYLRGLIARDMKRDADARADFEAALALDQVYLPIRYRLADTLVDLGDFDAARKLLEATVREHPDQSVPYAMLGQLSLRQKRYTDAVENLLAALKIEPQANQLYQPLAEAYQAIGNAQGAKDAEAKAGKTSPQLADPLGLALSIRTTPAGTPLQQAQQLAAAGKLPAARARLVEILREHPEDVEALALQARFAAAMGDRTAAEAAVDKALKLAPDNAAALLARAMVHEYGGKQDDAYAYYQRAVRADPKLPLARTLLGNAEMRRARYAQAAEQFRQLTVLEPDNARAYARLVAAEVAQGQCARALSDIGAAQVRNSRNGDLMQIFVRLASTCPAARSEERDMALDYAQTLYDQQPDGADASALALSLAAHGKFKEAQQYQAEAIFEAVRAGDKALADLYRSTQASFVAAKVPDRPWPAEHPYFKPPLLTDVARSAAPAAPVQ